MNRKKHTLLKKRSIIASILIPCFLIFGCARDITPPVAIPVAPQKTASAVPTFTKVNSGIDDTIVSNNKLGSKIKEQKEQFKIQKLDIEETLNNAEELLIILGEYACVPNDDINEVINGLHKIEARNLFLEKQNDELEAIRKEQEEILKMTKEDATITYKRLIDKENEADILRDQNDYLGKNLQNKNDEVLSLQKTLKDKETALARANVYKYWVWGLVAAFILWNVIKNVLMMYNPMARFRI